MNDDLIDLHTHTNCSDGHYSPIELIKLASKSNVKTISITDHDTIAAYNSNIVSFAKKNGVLLIPGVEFSTHDELTNHKIHVIGLNIDTNNKSLRSVCDYINQMRREAVFGIEKKLDKLGFKLRSYELLKSVSLITKSHMGKDVVNNSQNYQKLMDVYGKIPNHSLFIKDYIVEKKPANVKNNKKFLTSTAIKLIKSAGGKAICAHPCETVIHGLMSFKQICELILRNRFDGIEAIYIHYDPGSGKRTDMVKKFMNFAEKNNLLITGGSDFHSENDKYHQMGFGLVNEKYKVTNDQINKIIN